MFAIGDVFILLFNQNGIGHFSMATRFQQQCQMVDGLIRLVAQFPKSYQQRVAKVFRYYIQKTTKSSSKPLRKTIICKQKIYSEHISRHLFEFWCVVNSDEFSNKKTDQDSCRFKERNICVDIEIPWSFQLSNAYIFSMCKKWFFVHFKQ